MGRQMKCCVVGATYAEDDTSEPHPATVWGVHTVVDWLSEKECHELTLAGSYDLALCSFAAELPCGSVE